MKKFLFLLITIACIGVLVSGHLYWKDKINAAGIEGKKVAEIIEEKEDLKKEELMNKLRPENNIHQSTIDFLHYRALTKEQVIVAVVGSNVTAGTGATDSSYSWAEILQTKLQTSNPDLQSLRLTNHGYEGYTTSDLLISKKVDKVIKDAPDLVIFENSLINNHLRSVPLEQTLLDLQNIMAALKTGIPNARIFMMSPNPIVNKDTKNSLGLTYMDYINASKELIVKNNWPYIDSISGIEKKLTEDNLLLVDTLTNDYVNPNNKGNALWAEFLYAYLKSQ
ncbi:lysophospholipase L1-like esterase [Bacillus sp. SORGH_AS 510]|uniref:SGNH/GDSL hydrolase family protein n=1 Tax=Bacillus sp. SORGH_AS_0510 TaxID=3041771 RepID=UPI0027894D05|nr:SGNH/GDSL hydrolase family protein [Bacillus sp. SORGH_AS_0510]MDQ1144584.1 lysophospholipase L1-like esterase [Bacillus sp. SORGH_AS_0510]